MTMNPIDLLSAVQARWRTAALLGGALFLIIAILAFVAGFVLTDIPLGVTPGATAVATEDFNVPLLDHGRVKVGKLPITFVAPAAAAKSANTQFVFI